MSFPGSTNDEKTALIAARVLSVRDSNQTVYVERNGEPFACYGDAPKRRELRRFRYNPEKRKLLRGEIF